MLARLQSLARSAALMLALLFWGAAAIAQIALQDKTTADIQLDLLQKMQKISNSNNTQPSNLKNGN